MSDEEKVKVLQKFLSLPASIRESVVAGYALGRLGNAIENKGD